jgi:5'-nucleotidase (lipoprotein e(P4) family)
VTSPIQTQNSFITDGKLFATVFMQRAAEYHALCLQAYNIARVRLDEALKETSQKPRAIIADIDETVLDNSADEVHRSLQGKHFNLEDWYKWTSMAAADTIPGALSFLNYASSKGVKIFYITNRDEIEKAGTLKNLQKFNFPDANENHLLLRQTTSGKEGRRQQVMMEYNVVLLLGDNLSDFSDLYDKKSVEDRLDATKKQADLFGSRFIVLPNSIYGDWELALYQYKLLNPAQKDSAVKSWLKGH